MNVFFRELHDLNRWIILIVGIYVVIRAYQGWFGKKEWTDGDKRPNLIFIIAMDTQLLLGLLLYLFFSDITKAAFQDFGGAMANTTLRFYAVEHILIMLIAVIAAHIGYAGIRRYEQSGPRFRNLAIFYTLTFVLLLAGIPWDRALIPFLGQ
ncbi:MAG: hypothetical protein DWQ07_03165 [Chloroflexi bacterium]|nr:MAG: hypothetical protein DWQ07_03165 [Chloroflexota bacterium]MBL1193499.1 hypothetical protein [Chloroflexota bacterium]NOH10790.1 hypothetical protein [Chloroflexota bacterium]